MTKKIPSSLVSIVLSKRDELLTKINAKKRYVVNSEQGPNTKLAAISFNEGLDEAVKTILEVL